jgi:hypothetical protein
LLLQLGIVNKYQGFSVMRWLQIFISTLLLMSVSGFDMENDTDFYSSKAIAFEKCEEWKDKGNVVVYKTKRQHCGRGITIQR